MLAIWGWVPVVYNILIIFAGIFLILLVLIQRGKGGGLAGAFGGVGGSSPFGSRAGDTFTRITLAVAGIWIVMIMIQVVLIQNMSKKDDSLNKPEPGFMTGEGAKK